MSPVRLAVVIMAALIGSIGLALFARSLAVPSRPVVITAAAPVEAPLTRVLVAAHDLQPGDRLTAGDFTWQEWPKTGLNADFITDGPAGASARAPVTEKVVAAATIKARDTLAGGAAGAAADFVGALVRAPMLKSEPITAAKVVRATDTGMMAVTLSPGMRAMAVPLSAENSAGGFILPGDHVDLVQSRKVDLPTGGQKFASGVVLRNVKVLAVDQDTRAKDKAPAKVGTTATLEVTPEQAEFLALSKSQGELTLILRSYADIGGPTTEGSGVRSQGANFAPTVVRVFRNGAPADVVVGR